MKIANVCSETNLSHRIYRVPLTVPAGTTPPPPVYIGKLSNPPTALFISPRSTYLVALSANKAYTFRLPSKAPNHDWRAQCVKFVSDQPFTCGAFAPSRTYGDSNEEEWFATGDERGNIRLWHGLAAAFKQLASAGEGNPNKAFPDTEKRLPTTSLHWHAHAVGALAFTPSGAQLLSVGEESVLVQWHLASGKREFIPRLGGKPIISLAVKAGGKGVEEEWWMRLADGGVVRVGSASGAIKTVGQGVRFGELKRRSNSRYRADDP
jgi:NET1-associated nuclear protein 1 (U3 small nucleolar RNA-associated protein 17)